MFDICIDIDTDGDCPGFCKQEMRTARKEHKCVECGSTIHPGDRYEHTSGVWDGAWETFKTCRICKAVRADFFHGYLFGTLWEEMRQAYGLGFDTIEEPGRFDRWDWSDQDWAAIVKRRMRTAREKGPQSSVPELSPTPALTFETR